MLRLLIVDDEPIIADNYFDIFSEVNDLELDVYKAYSGYEALEWMRKTRIDIILCDICMPGLTGLDIQSEIRIQWPQCRVIFLSGHDEFDYVQSAMRNKGVDYVLKTEGADIVIQAVRRAASEIEREMKDGQLLQKAKENMRLAIPLLQEKYLLDIAEGADCGGGDMERQFSELEIPLCCELPVLLMIGRVDAWPGNADAAGKIKTLYGIRNIIEEYLKKTSAVISVIYERMWLLWMIQPEIPGAPDTDAARNRQAWERVLLYVKGTMDSIQDICRRMFSVSVSFVVGREPVLWENISVCFNSLKLTMNRAAGLTNEMLLIDGNADACESENIIGADTEMEHRARACVKKVNILEGLLESGQDEEFMRVYSEIMEAAGRSISTSYDVSAEVFHSISASFLSHMNRWNLMDNVRLKANLDLLPGMEMNCSWAEITAYFQHLAECIFEQKKDDCFRNAGRILGFIKSHAEQHLNGDLSLTRFADLLHFNPFYLSRLFRQVAGKSLSEYISDVRISKAKEMLLKSNMRISDITSYLGFETSSYFARFFKKHTGLAPQEYRDSVRT